MSGAVVTTVAVAAAVAAVLAAARGEDLRNVIITGFGEMPYEPAPGWRAGGFFHSDVLPASVNGEDSPYQTMDVALRTRILVEDPNEKKSSYDGAEDGVKSSSTNRQVSDKNNSLDQDKAQEIEEELLSARTRLGLRKLNSQRDTKDKSNRPPSVPQSSISISKYRQGKASLPPYAPPGADGYNNREYFGDLGEGWDLEDAEEILGGRNYNVLTQNPNGFKPRNRPPPPPPREIPPPRFPPGAFFPFPGFGYQPFPPPPSHRRTASDRSSRSRLREEVVYGVQHPRVAYDYLSGA